VPQKKLGTKNVQNLTQFRQLRTLIANISGTDEDIQNR